MLGRIHFYFGITIVLIFLLTGQYMHHQYDHLKNMQLMNRALFRAGHIYILLFGLINVALGINFKSINTYLLGKIQIIGSISVFVANFLVIYSFFTELPTEKIDRPLASISLYLMLLGIAIHGLTPRK